MTPTEREPQFRTDSPVLQERIVAREQEARQALVDAIKEVLGTPAGRRVWLWIRLELCRLEKGAPGARGDLERYAGRRDVAAEMGRAIESYPELRIALAKDRAATEIDDAAYQADLQRLKEERR